MNVIYLLRATRQDLSTVVNTNAGFWKTYSEALFACAKFQERENELDFDERLKWEVVEVFVN